MKLKKGKWSLLSVSIALGLALLATGCSSSTTGPAGGSSDQKITTNIDKTYSGSTITVLLPPWGQMPKSALDKFTKQTGIKVKMENMSWDNIHQQIVTSEAAHIAPADITEVDWSWVGQFSKSGWYTPLNKYIQPKVLQNNLAANIFTINNQVLAVPYGLDYRVVVLNMTYFKKAGIDTVPKTWTDILNDAQQIKSKSVVQYPIAIPMSITEGASVPWYELIKSDGGELFDSNWKPTFDSQDSPGAQALKFEKQIYDQQLVPPGEVSMTDVQNGDLFKAGKAAILLASSPGGLSGFLDPNSSKIAKDEIAMIAPPGQTPGQSGTFGLPDALGIPSLSKNKGAAAMFINWWMQTPQQITSYENPNMGNLPPEKYALQQLNQENKLVNGKDIMNSISGIEPLFKQGTPSWYPQFSNAVATMIQAVVQGKQTPDEGLKALAKETESFKQNP